MTLLVTKFILVYLFLLCAILSKNSESGIYIGFPSDTKWVSCRFLIGHHLNCHSALGPAVDPLVIPPGGHSEGHAGPINSRMNGLVNEGNLRRPRTDSGTLRGESSEVVYGGDILLPTQNIHNVTIV